MNRTQLQQLSTERIEEAEALLVVGKWSGAYYLAGYALECALKACVLKYIERTGVIFEDKRYGEKCWTHDLDDLVRLADLTAARGQAIASNAALEQNWDIVKRWSESSRYRLILQFEAEELVRAIDDKTDGVLTWLKNFW